MALTLFWATVTGGRVLFAAIEKRFPETRTYRFLPFVVAVAFALTALLPQGSVGLDMLAFALAGLGCSALLPLTISFGQEDMTVMAASVAGGLIAFSQIGYGIAAFGVGSLEDTAGLRLNVIFGATTLVALAMAALGFVIVRSHAAPRPASAPEQA